MQVVTLNPTDFEDKARQLAGMVEEGSPHHFDAIVAVWRGGSFVCDAFCRYFPKDRFGKRFDVTLQRPSTKRKEGAVSRWLKRLPRPVLDVMRMTEATILALRRIVKTGSPLSDVPLPAGLETILTTKTRPAILIIDDAIDSGDTLAAIEKSLRISNPDTRICIAVMTETTRRPRITADYKLYGNRTLIRFPWSNDYREA